MDNIIPTSVEPDNSLTLRTVDTDKVLNIQIVSFQNNRIYIFFSLLRFGFFSIDRPNQSEQKYFCHIYTVILYSDI